MIALENILMFSLLLFPYGTCAVSQKNIKDSFGSSFDSTFKTVKPPNPLSNIPMGLLLIIINLIVVADNKFFNSFKNCRSYQFSMF